MTKRDVCPMCEDPLIYEEEMITNFNNYNLHTKCFNEIKGWIRASDNMQIYNGEYKKSQLNQLQTLKPYTLINLCKT